MKVAFLQPVIMPILRHCYAPQDEIVLVPAIKAVPSSQG
jgi:hypothetical protein